MFGASHNRHRRQVHEEVLFQSFAAPQIPNSFRNIRTIKCPYDGFRTVLMRDLKEAYGAFDHIETDSVACLPLVDSPLHPRRIQAYPDRVIRVIYSSSENLPDLGALQDIEETTLSGGEEYYNEDDDGNNWDGDFTLTVRDPLSMGDVLDEHIAIPADLYMPNNVLASSIHTSTHATTSVSDTSASQSPLTGNNSSSVNQATHVFRFRLSPFPCYDNGSVSSSVGGSGEEYNNDDYSNDDDHNNNDARSDDDDYNSDDHDWNGGSPWIIQEEHDAKSADLSMSGNVLASSFHASVHANVSVSDTSVSIPPPTGKNSSTANQTIQNFGFRQPPPPRHTPSENIDNYTYVDDRPYFLRQPPPPHHTPSEIPVYDAYIEVPQLDNTSRELIESRSSVLQHLFILPEGWATDTQINNTESPFKLFRMCVCGLNDPDNSWEPHLLIESRPKVRNPHQFINLFAPTLLLGTRMFLASIDPHQEITNYASTSQPTYSFSDPSKAVEHILKELKLPSVDAVKTLLELMVRHLEEVLLPRQDAADSQQLSTSMNPTLERSQLSLDDMALLSTYVNVSHSDTSSAYLAFDKNRNDLWVCYHHLSCLIPRFQRYHVEHNIKRFGHYDAAKGKIDVHLRTPKDFTTLFRIDTNRVSRITELNVALDWRLSSAELERLINWAKSLNLTTLSVTGKSGEAGLTSVGSRSKASVAAEMDEVRGILLHTVNQLEHITITWDSDLDASALLQDVSPLRDSLLYLKIKTGRQEVSSVIFKGHVGVDHVKSDLGDLPLNSKGSFLAERIQSLTIGPGIFSTPIEQTTAWKAEVSSAIQENRALTSLAINCNAQDFETILDTLRSLLRELHNPSILRQSLRFIILKDIQNNITGRFHLAPLESESPELIDVTAGTIEPAHHSVMLKYGASIRVLNVLDGHIESSALLRDFAHAKPTRLVSLMLSLDRFSYQYGNDLSAITTASKDTLKQLVLIGHPRSNKTLSLLLDTIKSLRGCNVLVTRTGFASITTWIKRLQDVVQKSCRLIVVDSAEEMCLLVPGLSASGLVSLKRSFERNQRFIVKRKKTDPFEGEYEDEFIDYEDEVIEYGPDANYML